MQKCIKNKELYETARQTFINFNQLHKKTAR